LTDPEYMPQAFLMAGLQGPKFESR